MTRRRRLSLVVLTLVTLCWDAPANAVRVAAADTVPSRLSDREFWSLIKDVSEPDGTFRSENLLSNELQFQWVIPDLMRVAKAGRAYLGVGPEQNFTYIGSLEPSIAFILDVRRGNLDLHLLYKALFELSTTRADFVGLLFSRPRPQGLDVRSSAQDIFDAYAAQAPSERLFTETMARVRDRLLTTHGFELGDGDVRGIEFVLRAFLTFGPSIKYSPFGLAGGTVQPTYAALMAATDERGHTLSFLGREDRFAFVKGLQARNLIVPVVGNFAGPKALPALGAYLKTKGATVSAFYVSNVEEYLRRDGLWPEFCANVSTLPIDATSTFIRSARATPEDPMAGMRSEIAPMESCR